jgi:hypothetical protein
MVLLWEADFAKLFMEDPAVYGLSNLDSVWK